MAPEYSEYSEYVRFERDIQYTDSKAHSVASMGKSFAIPVDIVKDLLMDGR